MRMIEELAPAKINLALHVTGQRSDGYHLLDTLVTFAETGDRLTFAPADTDQLTISGRFGAGLSTGVDGAGGNLVLKARDALRNLAQGAGRAAGGVHIHLEKNLPIASGVGGGSADAAAALRGLNRVWGLGLDLDQLRGLGLPLGADVPMCLESRPLVARGIGEDIRLIHGFAELAILLVNPLVEVSTPAIFKRLTDKNNPPLDLPADHASMHAWISALRAARNDLQPPAEALAPEIIEAMDLLQTSEPLLARMSGSGATCFAVYADPQACRSARDQLQFKKPEWYWQETLTLGEP
jgi:4-diphosphocytidyl-2-C-methyl-D-erythritol kinase